MRYLLLALAVLLLPQFAGASEQLKHYARVRSQEYGIDFDKFSKLVQCESGWTHFYGQKATIITGDEGKALGLLQFWHGTFLKYQNDFWELYSRAPERTNPFDQIDVSMMMLQSDLNVPHWTNCSEKHKIISYRKEYNLLAGR